MAAAAVTGARASCCVGVRISVRGVNSFSEWKLSCFSLLDTHGIQLGVRQLQRPGGGGLPAEEPPAVHVHPGPVWNSRPVPAADALAPQKQTVHLRYGQCVGAHTHTRTHWVPTLHTLLLRLNIIGCEFSIVLYSSSCCSYFYFLFLSLCRCRSLLLSIRLD